MKVTAYALIAIGCAILLYAGFSHFAASPEEGGARATPFSPLIALVVGTIAALAGFLLLRFGGRGYTEKTATRTESPN